MEETGLQSLLMSSESGRDESGPAPGEFPSIESLPRGRRVELSRGVGFYREVKGPADSPTVVLLHGWMATGGLNWFQSFGPLGQSFRVIAPDLAGHGQGLRSWKAFSLRDCAEDVAQLIEKTTTGPVIVAGYSMGGAVAQLLWKHHPEKVAGLVLCATGPVLVPNLRHRIVLGATMSALVRTTRVAQASTYLPRQILGTLWPARNRPKSETLRHWAGSEIRRHDWRMVLEAGRDLGRFNAARWILRVDVPTAVIVTKRDAAIDPSVQLKMALAIPDARVHLIDDGHLSCTSPRFANVLSQACADVATAIPAA